MRERGTESADPQVLIVDDDQELISALNTELTHNGFFPLNAENGASALKILEERHERIGAVVSDWMMPEIDGLELLKKMRDNGKYQHIPFLMLSAKGHEEDVLKGLEAGANDYIRKPFNINEFSARLSNLVSNWEFQKLLREQAIKDALTRLYNYRYFMDTLRYETVRAKRYGGPLSLIMFDIDHFKHVNDHYGHPAGDFILKNIGDLLRKNTRSVDIACRYGGEEFTIILPSTIVDGAEFVARRLRKLIAGHEFTRADTVLAITCSFGVGCFNPDSETLDAFLQKVDRALYHSKQTGRDRVTVAD